LNLLNYLKFNFIIFQNREESKKINFNNIATLPPSVENAPQIKNKQFQRSIKFEEIRRKIFDDIKDVSYYIDSELTKRNLAMNVARIKTNFKHRIK
jgi:hypothetical protein